MKKTLLLVLFTSVSLYSGACGCCSMPNHRVPVGPYHGKNYADWGKLRLVENQLSDKNGDPVQLIGWSTQSLHSEDVQGCLGESQWELMKKYGANIVRLAMYIDEKDSYLSDSTKFKELIKQSIKETAALDMYCVVDWHISELGSAGTTGNPNDYLQESKSFFGEISKYCAENGYDNVLYEICNEPTCGWTNIKSYAEEVIPVITANQPDAIIVVGTDSWCQKIIEPVSNPIKSEYKKNVMYSFHYYACSHYSLLGDFRNAQKNIPVFVSEWSAVKFDGDGPFCKSNADEMVSDCDYKDNAPQVVSWCVWGWGKKDDATSFFTGSCDEDHISKYPSTNSNYEYGRYVLDLMGYWEEDEEYCDDYWPEPNKIPSVDTSLWSWGDYNIGGAYIAFHDANSGAWEIDENGVVVSYKNNGEEVDVFSLAKKMMWIDKACPWSTVDGNKVVAFDSTIATLWKDENGNPTYKSLNAGRNYSGPHGLARPDEGVDLKVADLKGINYENMGYNSLYLVEEDEWINYTVDVEKPGYYKLKGLISSEYKAIKKNGEISIISEHGNHLRSTSVLSDDNEISTFGFPKTTVCADDSISVSDISKCWAEADAVSGDHKEVLVAFPDAGIQGISIYFSGDASGVGPLIFEWYGDLDPNDPITGIDNIKSDALSFTINPNPTSGEFTITLAENIEANVEIVNMAGQVVVSQKIEGSAVINKVLSAGVYTVVVKSNGAVNTQKLVVK